MGKWLRSSGAPVSHTFFGNQKSVSNFINTFGHFLHVCLTLCASEFDIFDIWFWTLLLFLSKWCIKTYHETIEVKLLISNLFLVAYKLFLYKNRIKVATEAHKHSRSIALRGRGRSDFQDFWTRRRGASLVWGRIKIIKNQLNIFDIKNYIKLTFIFEQN